MGNTNFFGREFKNLNFKKKGYVVNIIYYFEIERLCIAHRAN